MHTKTATLTLLALIAASNAAPLSDRLSWSYVHRSQDLIQHGKADCNDEATTYGLDSGKTEGDCASMPNAIGFRAGAVTAECRIPVKDGEDIGICYIGGSTAAVPGGGAPSDEKNPCESTDASPKPSETPEKEAEAEPSPSPNAPPQSPVQPPAAAVFASPSSGTSEAPAAGTKTPGATPPKPNATGGKHEGNGTKKPGDPSWIGKSLFKLFGGLF